LKGAFDRAILSHHITSPQGFYIMADRRLIESRIKKKEQEIQELEAQIREARIYLQALQDVLRMFPKEVGGVAPTPEMTLRAGSLVAMARDAILKRGKAMHVDEMLTDMGKEVNRENKTALGGSLSAYVRRGMIFTRSGPNVFGLVELSDRPASAPEPPVDFGTEPKAANIDDDIPF
jgi:hypothetical protein